jgi:thiol:disulfide interchange protein
MPALGGVDLTTDGYPFAQAGNGQGADVLVHESEVRGELPEMAVHGHRGLWRANERKALAEARAQGRGVVIDFWAEWCDSCWRLEHETYAEPELRRAMLEQFVPVRIDVTEETQANREQLQRYAIVSLPTVLVLDSHGRVVDRIDQFLSSDAFLSRLTKTRSRRQVQARAR